jgi:hypothetical protein
LEAQNHIFVYALPVSTTLFKLPQQEHVSQKDVNEHNIRTGRYKLTTYVMHVQCNILERSGNHWYSGKATVHSMDVLVLHDTVSCK